jgi:NADH dehydrogenase (ubiquinone) 1 alpha subcomplex subunit 2
LKEKTKRMSKLFKFSQSIKELRIHLCQKSASSSGIRSFIEKNYVELKKLNPKTPILIRECSGVEPKLWARSEFGKESHISLCDMNESQVLTAVERLAK